TWDRSARSGDIAAAGACAVRPAELAHAERTTSFTAVRTRARRRRNTLMGILAPLFLASLAALSLPLIFHLVRRTPRGKQEFSSLLFLTPSPPRLTRRSRLDQI